MKITLLVVQGKPAGKKLRFPAGEYVFGRGNECHVRPDSDWVSRQHCMLRVTPNAAFIRDLGSRNGTLVNGELLSQERQLSAGDRIEIGPLVFELRCEKTDELVPPSERPTGAIAKDPTVKIDEAGRPPPEEIPESSPPEAPVEPGAGDPPSTARIARPL